MTDKVSITAQANGGYLLSGRLDRDTVPHFWRQRASWMPKEQKVTLDLSSVTRVDSAGMAMLLHLKRDIETNGQALSVTNIPQQLNTLLKLSHADSFLIDA